MFDPPKWILATVFTRQDSVHSKRRQARVLSAPKDNKKDAAGCAERTPFCVADFFSTLLRIEVASSGAKGTVNDER